MTLSSETRYFGVVGNRDYIKYAGQRRPFWDFLDKQPDGWLCSLAYLRDDVPSDRQRLWDCGAWSYKGEDIPKIKGNFVTAEWAFGEYKQRAQRGDLVVAPDHMLIPGTDVEKRRAFNQKSAKEFLTFTKASGLIPMACIHGETLDERLAHAQELQQVGYSHLAIGGLAGRGSKKKWVTDIVAAMRGSLPDIWLHVLGLSAPYYCGMWQQLGIDSFDGASSFKQAFSGTFFKEVNGLLKKHLAVKPGENPTAPACDCKACRMLREEDIDTRTYGSNQHNMGRAAHNLNMLMRAHAVVRTSLISNEEMQQHSLGFNEPEPLLDVVDRAYEPSCAV